MKRLFLLAFIVAFVYRSSAECIQASRQQCNEMIMGITSGVSAALTDIRGLKGQVSSLSSSAQDLEYDIYDIAPAFDECFNYSRYAFENLQNEAADNPGVLDSYYMSEVLYALEMASTKGSQVDKAWNAETLVTSILGDLSALDSSLDDLSTQVANISHAAEDFDCEPCAEEGSGGGGGCEGDGGCPCVAELEALRILLAQVQADVENIRTLLEAWDDYIKALAAIKENVKSIDDFMQDDLKTALENFAFSFYNLQDAKSKPNQIQYWKLYTAMMDWSLHYYGDYTNAVSFHLDGSSYEFMDVGKAIFHTPNANRPNDFDFGEYQKYNWFQRIEFLLAEIAGVFSPTNDFKSADLTEEQKETADEAGQTVENAFNEEGLTRYTDKVSAAIDNIASLKSKLNPFHGLFPGNRYGISSITIIPETSIDSSLLGGSSPGVELQITDYGESGTGIGRVLDFCHTFTTFLWFVLFLIADVAGFVFLVRGLMRIFEWYHKIVLSWVKTFNVR